MSIDDFVKKAMSQQELEAFNAQPYKIGNTEFSKVSYEKTSEESYAMFCKKMDDYYIMIFAVAKNEDKVNKLLSGFSKL